MIFVTLGSQKFQFNRLLKKIDELIENGIITEPVYAQIGYSDYHPKKFWHKSFIDRQEFASLMDEADIVITHGGTGVIVGAVKRGKKTIAVPRLAKYGEHVDDHQLQIVEEFDRVGMIYGCLNCDDMANALRKVSSMQLTSYVSNTDRYIDSIEEYIESL